MGRRSIATGLMNLMRAGQRTSPRTPIRRTGNRAPGKRQTAYSHRTDTTCVPASGNPESGGQLINRLKPFMEEPEERPPVAEYFEVICAATTYYVSRAEARRIASLLERRWPPRWIRAVDVFGAEIRVLRRTIAAICESTESLRQHERTFRRARRSEEKQDRRPWDDDDWW